MLLTVKVTNNVNIKQQLKSKVVCNIVNQFEFNSSWHNLLYIFSKMIGRKKVHE